MSNENNKMQVDIENLFKQNVNDLSAIKELYRKLKEVEEKFSQIKYIDSTLANKLKKDYEKLKKIILDENAQATLSNDIEKVETKLTNDIETIESQLTNDIETINSQLDNITTYVTYEMFGAKGDGVTDDGVAIKKAHDYANLNNLTVSCNPSANYFIENTSNISIKTNVNFNNAKFLIKDNSTNHKQPLFRVESRFEPITIPNSQYSFINIKRNTRHIPLLAGYGKCLVKVMNANKKTFIRKGLNATNGYSQVDYFIIDNIGQVMTDIIWDFEEITFIQLFPIDNTVLTITGGNFATDPYKIKTPEGLYSERGFYVTRSNVVFRSINHSIVNEGNGEPYNGFIHGYECAYLSIYESLFTPRTAYNRNSDNVVMGSYDLRFDGVVGLTVNNVDGMSLDESKWGVFTSNYSKDFYLDNCKFNRFDAHMGICNVSLKMCTFGSQGIRLVGWGKLLVEDTTVIHCPAYIHLRDDYGSNWDGDIIIKRGKFIPKSTYTPKLIDFNNVGTHDFGYTCRYGRNILIEDFVLDDSLIIQLSDSYTNPFLVYSDGNRLGDINSDLPYPYYMPQKMKFRNLTTTSGKGFILFAYMLERLYGHQPYSYEEETETTMLKRITMESNIDIVVDNVELRNFPVEEIMYSTSSIALLLPREESDLYLNNKNRILPNITFKNCKNVFASAQGYPMKLNLENCEVTQMVCENNGSRVKGSATNCTFSPKFIQKYITASVKANFKDFKFINCDFNKPYIEGLDTLTKEQLQSIYQFIGYLKTVSNSYIYARCIMTNCRLYEGFDWDLIDEKIKDCNFVFGNHNFNYYPSCRGYEGEKPQNTNCIIPIGLQYWSTTNSKFLTWNGEELIG